MTPIVVVLPLRLDDAYRRGVARWHASVWWLGWCHKGQPHPDWLQRMDGLSEGKDGRS